jgi:hypothetical protein
MLQVVLVLVPQNLWQRNLTYPDQRLLLVMQVALVPQNLCQPNLRLLLLMRVPLVPQNLCQPNLTCPGQRLLMQVNLAMLNPPVLTQQSLTR